MSGIPINNPKAVVFFLSKCSLADFSPPWSVPFLFHFGDGCRIPPYTKFSSNNFMRGPDTAFQL